MRELSLHILDLAQNSVEAGARNLQIDIDENGKRIVLHFSISDDGRGMTEEMVQKSARPVCYHTPDAQSRYGHTLYGYGNRPVRRLF